MKIHKESVLRLHCNCSFVITLHDAERFAGVITEYFSNTTEMMATVEIMTVDGVVSFRKGEYTLYNARVVMGTFNGMSYYANRQKIQRLLRGNHLARA